MAKVKKKKKKKVQSLIHDYNAIETKNDISNTLTKSLVDTIAGAVVGTGLGAFTGKYAPLAGIALIIAGHYTGDKTGLLRLTGASTLSFAVAKAKDYQNQTDYKTVQQRMTGLKEDLLTTLHIQWKKDLEVQKKEVDTDNDQDKGDNLSENKDQNAQTP